MLCGRCPHGGTVMLEWRVQYYMAGVLMVGTVMLEWRVQCYVAGVLMGGTVMLE